jgi:hypothetical protein
VKSKTAFVLVIWRSSPAAGNKKFTSIMKRKETYFASFSPKELFSLAGLSGLAIGVFDYLEQQPLNRRGI